MFDLLSFLCSGISKYRKADGVVEVWTIIIIVVVIINIHVEKTNRIICGLRELMLNLQFLSLVCPEGWFGVFILFFF